MELILKRETRTEESTIGSLFIGDNFECYILEDKDRGLKQSMPLDEIKNIKVQGKAAIPEGRYEIVITFSNRFQKALPLLVNVPGFEGIRIHPGNTAADTEGCLITGNFRSKDMVTESRKAFNQLFGKIKEAAKKEKIWITI